MQNRQPNIIFIMADQLGAASLGCYGSGVDSTPALDGLAAEGTRYDRCYATVPLCGPNRACFLTGRSPAVHGMMGNNYVLRADIPTYAHVLQAHGYRTGGFGKFHQTPMHCPLPKSMDYLGFDESMNTDDTKWTWYEWVAREHPEYADTALAMCWDFWPSHPRHPLAERCRELKKAIIEPLKRQSCWPLMYPSPLPPEVHDTTFITETGLNFMRRHLDAHPDQPFFCHISFVDPHDPYDPPEPYASRYNPDDMRDPAPAEWMTDNPIPELLGAHRGMATPQLVEQGPGAVRALRALYHGSLKYMDDQIARVITFVRERGIWENTILIFTTDHGEMLGDHALMTKGLKHYDMGIRCPLIIAGGGIPAGVTDRLTCTLDFFPTFCDWADIPAQDRPPLEGRSINDSGWDAVSVAISTAESVVTDDGWRLTRYLESGRMQLFNLKGDPAEQHDRIDDPAYASQKSALLEKLVDVMARPRRVINYRNLPVIDGKKMPVIEDRMLAGTAWYPEYQAPLLNE